jgi:hypothetical protein
MTPRILPLALLPFAACYEATPAAGSRVWSEANSQEGYAACPRDTTVTGGGYEFKENELAQGHIPLVIASRPEGNGWRVICVDANHQLSLACRAWALCASVLAR